jgi:hypothetical protein
MMKHGGKKLIEIPRRHSVTIDCAVKKETGI